jgi:hypothetical protein
MKIAERRKPVPVAIVALVGLYYCGPTMAADFATRCADPNVVRCVPFDSATEIAGRHGDASGILIGASTPVIDSAVKASGGGSIKFTIPSNSPADTSGSYFTNFSDDRTLLFGENTEFFIQWRQRFSPEFLNTPYAALGWKQFIVGTGDIPGRLASSCTSLEVVMVNPYHRGFPEMYNSCSGSASHGPYDPFEEPFNGSDFKLQNARPSPYCLYSAKYATPPSYFPPAGNCFGYFANEWMTFQVQVKTGPRVGNEFQNSFVRAWIARQGQPSELVIDWGPYNLAAGPAGDNERFGKVWLIPYNTDKNSSQVHAVGYTWYDELIVSRAKIADADGGAPTTTPRPPTNVTAN